MKTFDRIHEDLGKQCKKKHGRMRTSEQTEFVKEMVFETIVFLDIAHSYIKGQPANINWGKRNVASSEELFNSSKILFWKVKSENILSDFIIRPTSIVLLRQAIELKVKNALGIAEIRNKDGRLFRIPGTVFIEIFRENPNEIEIPVEISILLKIHDWTQYFVHGGYIPNMWEMEWTYYLLNKLFKPFYDEKTGRFDRHGAIKIKKTFYSRTDELIRDLLMRNPGKMAKQGVQTRDDILITRLRKSESMLVD